MSKIEVDAIDKQSGSTLTLGGSGTAVTLASGATQSGFGRTGTVDWQTGSIKTATFTATSGEGYFCNTAGGAFTVNLPAGSAGAIVSVQDYNNTFDSNDLTVSPNGSEKINGGTGAIALNTEGEGLTLVYIDSTVGWRSIQDSAFSDQGSNYVTATGGTITTCGDYKIHSFTGPGTLSVTSAGAPAGSNTVEYMIVAGGGGGGAGRAGGGGGGGFRTCTAFSIAASNYPITIGAGGAGGGDSVQPGCGENGTSGSPTTALGRTSTGGGAGGGGDSSTASAGGSGGGGGGAAYPRPGGAGNTPPVSPPQGNAGGTSCASGLCAAASGGGGASAVGTAAVGPGASSVAGPGGAGGTAVPIFGSSPKPFYGPTNGIYAGGGGGGASDGPSYGPGRTVGSGGPGGGGAGGKGNNSPAASAGLTNTGGGGGGGGHYGTGAPGPGFQGKAGGAGGSGIVLIRYKFQN